MCLIVLAYRQKPGFNLVLAANRDEFLDRPTAPLGYNFADGTILAGKDLRGGGTWLGLGANGRLAAITNYRDPARVTEPAPSRGEILLRYLQSTVTATQFLQGFAEMASRYNGFNLLLADETTLIHYSNITGKTTPLEPGIYGVSNHLLNTPWPKVSRSRELLQRALAENDVIDTDTLFSFLRDTTEPEDSLLPETGVGLEWERRLSPIFIHSPSYGTRSSAVITITDNGEADFYERSYCHKDGVKIDGRKHFSFVLKG